jgi:hypothetical protein
MRSRVASALDGLFAKSASVGARVRDVVFGAVLVASFVAPGAASVAQGSALAARVTAQPGVVMVHPNPECSGAGIPC